MLPPISVIIPTYCRPAALQRTLAALAQQSVATPFDITVCDDGTPEPQSAEIQSIIDAARAGSSAQSPLDVRLIRQENAGPAAARNTAARAAPSDLLLFLDDDCAPASDLLVRHLNAHQAAQKIAPQVVALVETPRDGTASATQSEAPGAAPQPARVAVMGHVAWSPDLPRVSPFMELVVRGAQFNYGAITDPDRVPFTCFYTANCSLWRANLAQAGWFDASLPPFMEDTEFAYRLVQSGVRILYRPDAVVHHEHEVELEPYLERQRKAGRAAVEVARRHPELFDTVGVNRVADVALRERFYTALLEYAFVVGVEEGLAGQLERGELTGSELHGQFERWIAGWAVHQAGETRAWRERADALEAELARRDGALSRIVQDKDATIAGLEAQVRRFHALAPVRVAQRVKRMLGGAESPQTKGVHE